jgi:hypothetical protein
LPKEFEEAKIIVMKAKKFIKSSKVKDFTKWWE